MSWKLAELRWRQNIGLRERSWERDIDTENDLQDGGDPKSHPVEWCRRARSRTAPWFFLSSETGPTGDTSGDAFRPDPSPSPLSLGIPESSTTPLLKITQELTNTTGDDLGLFFIKDKDVSQAYGVFTAVHSPHRSVSPLLNASPLSPISQSQRSLVCGKGLSFENT